MEIQKICTMIQKADQDFHLFEENDRIALGLSGGKDSMVLLYALSIYQRYAPVAFEVIAIHLNMGFQEVNTQPMKEFCETHHIEYHEEKVAIAETLMQHEKNGRLSCSRCSKYKKACMSEACRRYHCNKIAFAHHKDDAIETLFMNMIHGGRIAVFEPKIYLERNKLTLIRPLVYVSEKNILRVVETENIPLTANPCPNDKTSERAHIKALLQDIYKQYPSAKDNFAKMLIYDDKVRLWRKK